ncbi:hypothetical protein [Thioalkalivibrio paradoxus]|uniref:Glycosyltransferase RgtA/B/C/D-like domain-containing protein n=1 Tax=Thioalkalivibrio paradoxus ARh 1 TaxID=713585 RepID=W0DJC0_9GAMM|nr:hypothetical protein [Thioalkalivibrio paradoxus]AHE98546.1 hypothetical protein THITH_10110 [Thioalkalivibrio paradoxus ARh 1]
MSSSDALNLAFALMLPWLAGVAWAGLFWRRRTAGRIPAVLGYGFLLGWTFLVLILLGLDAAGISQSVTVAVVLLGAAAALGLLLRRWVDLSPKFDSRGATGWAALSVSGRVAAGLLLALVAVRLGTLLPEVVWRPLYPWDAWMNWAPKARAWFEHGWLVPFVSRDDWMAGGADAGFYTMMNWDHPPAVPLIHLWSALMLGHWDDGLINLPWWFLLVAMALALYGQARGAGASPLLALLGVYLLVSIPLVASHVALAGYGDLWIGGLMLLAGMSLHSWGRDGNARQGLLLLACAAALPLFKSPGLVWALILVAVALVARLRVLPFLIAAALAVTGLGLLVVTVGVDVELPRVGRVALGPDGVVLPYMWSRDIQVYPVWDVVAGHLFVWGTWHMLWYATAIALLAGIWLGIRDRGVRALWLVTILGLLFLFVVFFLTGKHRDAVDGTTLNRALLHLAPVAVALILSLFHQPRDAVRIAGPEQSGAGERPRTVSVGG